MSAPEIIKELLPILFAAKTKGEVKFKVEEIIQGLPDDGIDYSGSVEAISEVFRSLSEPQQNQLNELIFGALLIAVQSVCE